MKKLLLLFVVFAFAISCKNDDDFGGNSPDNDNHVITDAQFAQDHFGQAITSNFIGRVVNKSGNQIKDVQITIGNQTVMTDHNGVFVLNNVSVYEKFSFIKATKNGYIQGSRSLVPTLSGTNDVQITLLEKNIVGAVNSGEISEVSLPNGAKVEFTGDFIDVSGNEYSGQVDVSLHYLEPNQEGTFTEMPGMLFGQRENGSASAMETYGMLAVNLYSPSGQELNIADTSPATMIFPVSSTTPNAPDSIPLWYFDELTGYWKEQGIANRIGSDYIAEVNHFTWWNCDVPLDYVNVCFELVSENLLTNFYFEIKRSITNQLLFSGYTNDIGQECGLFPAEEEVTINVFGDCTGNIIYSQTLNLNSFSSGSLISIMVPSLSTELVETVLIGSVSTCTGYSVTNGYVLIYKNSNSEFVQFFRF